MASELNFSDIGCFSPKLCITEVSVRISYFKHDIENPFFQSKFMSFHELFFIENSKFMVICDKNSKFMGFCSLKNYMFLTLQNITFN